MRPRLKLTLALCGLLTAMVFSLLFSRSVHAEDGPMCLDAGSVDPQQVACTSDFECPNLDHCCPPTPCNDYRAHCSEVCTACGGWKVDPY